jgi:hypothetical protein
VKRLDALFELSKDVHIHVFVECGGKSQVQIPRPVRRVVRTFAYFLGRLKQVRYDVTIIMNSSYVPVPAPIVNDVESRFSHCSQANLPLHIYPPGQRMRHFGY